MGGGRHAGHDAECSRRFELLLARNEAHQDIFRKRDARHGLRPGDDEHDASDEEPAAKRCRIIEEPVSDADGGRSSGPSRRAAPVGSPSIISGSKVHRPTVETMWPRGHLDMVFSCLKASSALKVLEHIAIDSFLF